MPCSLQSTAHSLSYAPPLVCSLSLYSLSLSFYSSSLLSSSVLPLYISHVVSFTLSLSLGSLPLFRFPFRRRLYRHLGLSDCRLTYPPPPNLAHCRLLLLSTFYSLSTTSLLLLFNLAGLPSLLSVWELTIDLRTPTTSRTLSLYAA